jgi:hypothetical protein
VKGRRGRRRKQLLDSLKKRKTLRLKDEPLYCTERRTVCGQRDDLVMMIMMMMSGVMNPTRYYFCHTDLTVF